jgi:hypothetical protein
LLAEDVVDDPLHRRYVEALRRYGEPEEVGSNVAMRQTGVMQPLPSISELREVAKRIERRFQPCFSEAGAEMSVSVNRSFDLGTRAKSLGLYAEVEWVEQRVHEHVHQDLARRRWFSRAWVRSLAEAIANTEGTLENWLKCPRASAQLVAAVTEVLYRHDPIHIAYVRDEYRPEAVSIVSRLPTARGVEDLQRIVHEEFIHWFSPEDASDQERYRHAAAEIWQLWQRWKEPVGPNE